jgi:CHAT domain-containing protein
MKNTCGLRISIFAGIVAALTMGAAQAAPGDLGNDAAGEACRLAGNDILCGPSSSNASSGKAGHLDLVPANASVAVAQRRGAIAAAIRALPEDPQTGALHCDDGKSIDDNTYLFICTAGTSSWPRILLASLRPGGLYLANGLPGTIEPLSVAIAAEAGGPVSGAQAAAAAVRAAFPPRALSASMADYSGYQRSLTEAAHESAGRDYATAEASYRQALDIETRLFGPDSAAVGGTLMELALQVSNQQRFDEAAALFRRATPIINAQPSPEIRARLASYMGLDAANQRNYPQALIYARQDTTARQTAMDAVLNGGLDLNGNRPQVPTSMAGEMAHALRIESEMALRTGDLAGAQTAAEQALYLVSQHPDLPLAWRADMVSLIGEVNAAQGRVVVAEKNFIDAVAMEKRLYGDNGPAIQAELQLGGFYSDQQLYPAALTSYRAAFAALAKDPLTRSQLVTDQITPFLAAASASLDSDRARLESEIFTASQLIGSDVAGQTIIRMAEGRAADNPALAQEVRDVDDAGRARDQLRMDLALEQAKTSDQRNQTREQQLTASLTAAVSKNDTLATKLHTDFPAYAGLADPGTASLDAVRRALRPREAFVSFMIGVRQSFVLLVTANGLTVRPLDTNRDELATEIADLRGAFTPQLGRLPEFSLAGAATLYKKTLGPVAPQLSGFDHLVVAAGGDLASLPFALLVTADAARPNDYSGAAWLVRQMAVSQVPSARAFLALRQSPAKPQPRPFLGVGNPDFQGNTASPAAMNALAAACLDGPADPALLRGLPPLPDTAAEVQSVGRDLNAAPGDILTGNGASETALRAKPLDQYGVLYFATHGLLPGELHCQSEPGIVLSPPAGAASSTNADGLLTASEIAGLRLNAGLVVLSACNTAAAGGKSFGGSALEGLADSFFNAGAHAVLASHWEVPSAATTSLMTGMFDNLARDPGHDVAGALRQAQLRLIAQPATAHPFDWAAFTLIGDGT